jgi:hypothetical protein
MNFVVLVPFSDRLVQLVLGVTCGPQSANPRTDSAVSGTVVTSPTP